MGRTELLTTIDTNSAFVLKQITALHRQIQNLLISLNNNLDKLEKIDLITL